MDGWEHDLNVEEYKIKLRAFREQEAAWNENKAKCYYLVLSHCPKELETELRNNSKWEETESNQDMVALLLMIRDVTHNKKERKESVMTIVESDVELFTITQEANQTLDDYYKIFKAQVDTIDAHGGNAGHHPVVFQLHLAALLKKGGKTNDDYVAMSTSDQAGRALLQTEALKTSKGAYLACLFLLMADERRFGGVKATLGDNFLLGKQEYPQDLLAAKRLLADFKGTGPTSRKATEPAPGQGVAFVEGGKGRYVPNCYGCGKKCQGGYKACKHITDEHRAKVAKLDANGAFWKKKQSGNETKQGTVNVVAGNDDDDNGSEENATNTTSTHNKRAYRGQAVIQAALGGCEAGRRGQHQRRDPQEKEARRNL